MAGQAKKKKKIILDLPIGSSASEALNKLKWKPLARRRAEHRAIFIYKCLNNLFSHLFNIEFNKDKHGYNTRGKTISVRVHLVGIGGIGLRQILIRQSPSLSNFKEL